MNSFFFPTPYSNPEAKNWVDRVHSAGSSVSRVSAQMHDIFVSRLKSESLWSTLLSGRLNTYGANDLTGAMVPLINTAGSTVDTNHNFVSGDFSLAAGLTGDGATKYLDTGAAPSSFCSVSSGHLGVINANPSPAASFVDIGVGQDGGTWATFYTSFSGTTYFDFFDQFSGRTSGASSGPSGFYVGSRTTGSSSFVFRNGVQILTSSTATSSSPPTQTVFSFCNNSSGPTAFSSNTQQAYTLGAGLTGVQATSYYEALNALMIGIGRGAIPV